VGSMENNHRTESQRQSLSVHCLQNSITEKIDSASRAENTEYYKLFSTLWETTSQDPMPGGCSQACQN